MWNRFLGFLAWAGLWQPQLEVFNRAAPVMRTPLNSSQLLERTSDLMTSLLEGYVTESGRQVSYQALEESVFYKQSFGQLGSLLQSADPLLLQPEERKTLFLNLYNLLTIQAIVSMDALPRSTISVPQFWRRYAYQVGPYSLHLDDIEHGILRGNRPHPTTGTTMFPANDPRLALTLPADHRIHGCLNCAALSCPPLQSYYVDRLEDQLDDGFHTFCNGSVRLLSDNSLLINSIFDWFRVDFGSTEGSVLELLAEQVEDPTITQALIEASQGQRRFSYDYDWTLNAGTGASGKVKVGVYFESLCPDSIHFFTRQLYPLWTQLKDIMDLELVPYGKARATPTNDGDYNFDCQHGRNECHGNKVMSCIQNYYPIETQMTVMNCMMSQRYPAFAGPKCSGQHLQWDTVDTCSRTPTGSSFLYQNGIKTAAIRPQRFFVPTVTIDGEYFDAEKQRSLSSFKTALCNAYRGPPHQNCL